MNSNAQAGGNHSDLLSSIMEATSTTKGKRQTPVNIQVYRIIPQAIPQGKRAEVNEKIISAIGAADSVLAPEAVYNCYTGVGGLHGLRRDDYANYHEYSDAKKEIEQGQFFTPHPVCRDMVELLAPVPEDQVLDMCCGMGNFINWLPNRHNAHGFDDHNILTHGIHNGGYIHRGDRKAAQVASCRKAANENAVIGGMACHAYAVAQYSSARKGTGWIYSYHANGLSVLAKS